MLAQGDVHFGEYEYQNKNLDRADSFYISATARFRRLTAADAAGFEPQLAAVLLDHAAVCFDMSDYQRAESLGQQALETRRRMAKQGVLTDPAGVAIASGNLGITCLYQKKYDLALPLLTEALDTVRALAAAAPKRYEYLEAEYSMQLSTLYREQYE
ncbi:MAG TPA: tetratricopeptide repeat protein, partial [Saprospiraceae bacterium]|nr:tetratricopeptide repeat protein [Saprospiraceae bacterium]